MNMKHYYNPTIFCYRYSGELREIGGHIDTLAGFIWEHVSKFTLLHCLILKGNSDVNYLYFFILFINRE